MATPPFTPLIVSGGTLSYVPSTPGLPGAYSTGAGVYNASVISGTPPTFVVGGVLDITYRLNVAGSPNTRVSGAAEIGIGFTQNPVPAAWVHNPLVVTYPIVSAGAYATGRATLAWGPFLSPPVFDILDVHYQVSGGAKSSGIATVSMVQNVYRPVSGGTLNVRYQVNGGAAGSGGAYTQQDQGVKVNPPVAGGIISASYLPSGGAFGNGMAAVMSSTPEIRVVSGGTITAEYLTSEGAVGGGEALITQSLGAMLRLVAGGTISSEYQVDGGAFGSSGAAVTSSAIVVRPVAGGTINASYIASGGAAGGGSGFVISSESVLRLVAGGTIDVEYIPSGGATWGGSAAVVSSAPVIRPVAGGIIDIDYLTSGGAVADGEAPFINQSGAMIRLVSGAVDIEYPVSGGAVWGGKAAVLSDAPLLYLVAGGALEVDFPVDGGGVFPESDSDIEGVFPGARVYQQSGPMLRLVTDAPVSQSYFPDGEVDHLYSGAAVIGIGFVGSPFTPTLLAGGLSTMVVVASGGAKGNGAAKWQRLNYPTSTVTGGGIAGGGANVIVAGMPREIIRDEVIYLGGSDDGDFGPPSSQIDLNASLGNPGGGGGNGLDNDNENTGGKDDDVILGDYEVEGYPQDKLDGMTIITVITYKLGIVTIVVVPSGPGRGPKGPPPQINVTLSGTWPSYGGKSKLVLQDNSEFQLPPGSTGDDTIFLGFPQRNGAAGNKDWNLADFLKINDTTTGGDIGGGIYNPAPAPGQSSFIFSDLGLHANLLSSTCALVAYMPDHIVGRLPFLDVFMRDVPDGIYGNLTLVESSFDFIVIETELPLMECEFVVEYGFIEAELFRLDCLLLDTQGSIECDLPLIDCLIEIEYKLVEAELLLLDCFLTDIPDSIEAELLLIESSIDVMSADIEAELTLIDSSFDFITIEAELTLLENSIESYVIEAELTLIESSFDFIVIEAELPLLIESSFEFTVIEAELLLIDSSFDFIVIEAELPLVESAFESFVIEAELTLIESAFEFITVEAELPLIESSFEFFVIEAELTLAESSFDFIVIEAELTLIESLIDLSVIEAELTLVESSFDFITIEAELPTPIESSFEFIVIEAELPLVESSFDFIVIDAELPLSIESSFEFIIIETELTLLDSSIEVSSGLIDAELLLIESSIDVMYIVIEAELTLVDSSIEVMHIVIEAELTMIEALIECASGLIDAEFPLVECAFVVEYKFIDAELTLLGCIFVLPGTIDAMLPRISVDIDIDDGIAPGDQMQTLVVNTHTSAISTYEEYPFNSYCEVDGVYFGASATGLYRLDKGNNDAGQSINAGVGTGIMDLGSPMLKRLLDASATMRSDGGIRLTINVDEAARHAAVTLPMIPRASSGLVKYRGTVPKGLRGKAWQFELENVNGDQFEFAELSIASMPVLRRV